MKQVMTMNTIRTTKSVSAVYSSQARSSLIANIEFIVSTKKKFGQRGQMKSMMYIIFYGFPQKKSSIHFQFVAVRT